MQSALSNPTSIVRRGMLAVGMGHGSAGQEAVRWKDGAIQGLGDLPGGVFNSFANRVSANGSVIVGKSSSFLNSQDGEAFRWTDCGMVGLGSLGVSSNAWAVSADGSIVVGFSFSGGPVAFIWDDANGMRNLQDVLTNDYGLDLTGWVLKHAKGISLDGTAIVGTGSNPDGDDEAWIATIPQLTYVRGDFTDDGQVTPVDLPPFVAVLLDPCAASFPDRRAADMSEDGSVDGGDIQFFVDRFLAPGLPKPRS